MFTNTVEPDEVTPAGFRRAYAAELAAIIETRGRTAVAEATMLEPDVVDALAERDDATIRDLTLEEAAAVLSLAEDAPTADAIVAESRDDLLLGMTSAVLDVDTIAAEIEADLTGQELQQAIEGRTRLKLGELAGIQAVIEQRRN